MNPGKFDRRITIQELTTSKNSNYGSENETWADKWTLWAQFESYYRGVTGKEEYEADKQTAVSEVVFRIRYKEALMGGEKKYRVLFNNRTYDINEIREDIEQYRRSYMKLICDAR